MTQFIIKRLINETPVIVGFEVVIENEVFHFHKKVELNKADREPGRFPVLPGDSKEEVK